ncbi:MAG: hypothetical protein RL385_6116 [Pseudomonadota bacterium]|jgi:hypothetical protein
MKTSRRGTTAAAAALLSTTVLCWSPATTSALEDQYSIDAACSAGLAVSGSLTAATLGLEAGSSLGLGPSFVLRGGLGASRWNAHGAPPHFGGRLHADLLYAFDILRVVPALGIGVSVEGLRGSATSTDRQLSVLAGPHFASSFDYLLSRNTSLALDLRGRILFGAGHTVIVAPEARLRVSWLIDS